MPAFVRSTRDERLWKEARRQAAKRFREGSQRYWAYANDVFHRMKYRVGGAQYTIRGNPRELIPGGMAEGMTPSQFNEEDLLKGTQHEMEHTRDPAYAQEIAMDHLVEDPRYYEKLAALENPGDPQPSQKVREAYVRFHGVEPETMEEGTLWVPGPMVYMGPCLDIGYKPPKHSNKGQYHYVHDHHKGVKVYCRPDVAPSDASPALHYSKFPKEIWALGSNIGFTYKDRFDNEEYEVKGSSKKKLCTDSTGKRLYVVDSKGILFLVKGGKMQVTDWIRY